MGAARPVARWRKAVGRGWGWDEGGERWWRVGSVQVGSGCEGGVAAGLGVGKKKKKVGKGRMKKKLGEIRWKRDE